MMGNNIVIIKMHNMKTESHKLFIYIYIIGELCIHYKFKLKKKQCYKYFLFILNLRFIQNSSSKLNTVLSV